MPSTEGLYLIAHKVRGERAFDIAIQMPMADGPWWIIPTSGHRAHPYWWIPLDEMTLDLDPRVPMPVDLPDHYPSAPIVWGSSPAKRVSVSQTASRNQAPETPTAEDL